MVPLETIDMSFVPHGFERAFGQKTGALSLK
jgi:hypothetical protein